MRKILFLISFLFAIPCAAQVNVSGSQIQIGGGGVTVQNAGITLGTATVLDFSTNTSASLSGSVATITATGGGGGAGYAVQHTFTFTGSGSQTFTHNLGIQYPFYSCATTSGAQFSPTWMTWTDANNVTMNAPAATVTVCNFGQSNTATSLSNPAACPDTSGSGTAQSCTTTPTITVAANACIAYSTTTPNSGTALTLAVNGGAAAPVAIQVYSGGTWNWTTTLVPGTISAGRSYLMCNDGTDWDAQTPAAGSASAGLTNLCSAVTITNATCSGGVIKPSGSATSVTIASIPGTYLRLILTVTGQTTVASGGDLVYLTINGDTGAHYSYSDVAIYLSTGGSALAEKGWLVVPSSTNSCVLRTSSAAGIGDCRFEFSNYASASFAWKSFSYDTGWGPDSTTFDFRNGQEVWQPSTASAITQLSLTSGSGSNLLATDQILLYGTN